MENLNDEECIIEEYFRRKEEYLRKKKYYEGLIYQYNYLTDNPFEKALKELILDFELLENDNDITFNKTLLINNTEIIQDCVNSVPLTGAELTSKEKDDEKIDFLDGYVPKSSFDEVNDKKKTEEENNLLLYLIMGGFYFG